ncbi:hypothetical protein CHS0354_040621 [Potamilus streckersoni]|uniref:Fibronectin type-III domain-containing protein n=1 Tax=Potamilus streckersoni TaxID=2493646 RepID=A0AAE0VVK2_9BIVA|nr:hypothetical protein CHS0354_040621 [Potamilus streckersoni]
MVWDKPEIADKEIQCYELKYKIKDEKQWHSETTPNNLTSLLIQGLRSSTWYEFKVRAIFDDDTEGPFSDVHKHTATRQSLAENIIPDATKIKDGHPAIYKLPLHINNKSLNQKSKTRKCIFGKRGIHDVSEKTILVVGATGSGKSTLIDGMVNYLLGVNWEDKYRFTIIDKIEEENVKKSDQFKQRQSQTDWITCYTIHIPETRKTNHIFNIIDTPGLGDTEELQRDQIIVDQIRDFFTMTPPQGIETLDAVCFVTQANFERFTPHQSHILDSILSIFGKDISNNIFVLITFVDGTDPPVKKALEHAKIPFKKIFQFNNSALFLSKQQPENSPFGPVFWNMGKDNFKLFFEELEKTETKCLFLPKNVSKTRDKLDETIQQLLQQMQKGLHVIITITQEKRIIDQHMPDIEANKEFEYEVEDIHQRKIDLTEGEYVSRCLTCNTICQYKSKIPSHVEEHDCSSVNSTDSCTRCSKGCSWSQHVETKYRFEFYPETVTKTFEDLKIKYGIAREKERQYSIYVSNMKEQINQVCGRVFSLIKQAINCINELNQEELEKNPLSRVEYIQLLIEAEKKEVNYGWQNRVEMLEVFKKQPSIIKEIANQEFRPWTDEELDELLKESNHDSGRKRIIKYQITLALVHSKIGNLFSMHSFE